MTFSVTWSFPARTDLTKMHWRDAGNVDGAVQVFARTGFGRVESIPGEGLRRWLHVGHFSVLLQVDTARRQLYVLRIYG